MDDGKSEGTSDGMLEMEGAGEIVGEGEGIKEGTSDGMSDLYFLLPPFPPLPLLANATFCKSIK